MIGAYLTDSVVLVEPASTTVFGQPGGAATETTLRARVESKDHLIRDQQGDNVTSTTQVLIQDRTIPATAKIRIGSVEHSIIRKVEKKDFGVVGLKLFLD